MREFIDKKYKKKLKEEKKKHVSLILFDSNEKWMNEFSFDIYIDKIEDKELIILFSSLR